jgi:hypothetical protein
MTADAVVLSELVGSLTADSIIDNPLAVRFIVSHATKGIMFRTIQSKAVSYETEMSKAVASVATMPTKE